MKNEYYDISTLYDLKVRLNTNTQWAQFRERTHSLHFGLQISASFLHCPSTVSNASFGELDLSSYEKMFHSKYWIARACSMGPCSQQELEQKSNGVVRLLLVGHPVQLPFQFWNPFYNISDWWSTTAGSFPGTGRSLLLWDICLINE